jgi:fucose permease
MNYKTIPIFLAFLCMGFADAVGPFVSLAKHHFQLSNFLAQLIPFVGFSMFGLLSIPIGLLQDRTGKKFILLLGLAMALAGLVLPLFGLTRYLLFLTTILMLGAGAAILQVAGNPIMRDVSPPEKYPRNLSMGQFIKSIGSLSGSLIPFIAARWFHRDWQVLFPIYSLALLTTIILVSATRVEEHHEGSGRPATLASCLSLLGNAYVLMMVLGIFIYVGAEVCVSTGVPTYLNERFGIDLQTWGILGNSFFFIWIVSGRFLGAVVLNWISPQKFLLATVLLSIVGVLGLLFSGSPAAAVVSIALVGMGFANIFPLVFSIAVNRMPERSNEISGLMVTAIVGAAIVPPLMGLLADWTSVRIGFVVPLCCAMYLTYVSLVSLKLRPVAHEI